MMAGENGNGNGGNGGLTAQMSIALQTAATLRAYGQTWEQVSTAIGRTVDAMKKWPQRHRAEWEAIYSEASQRVWDEAEAEARDVQRKLLRSEDERVRQSAAHSLMACARHSRPQKHEVTGAAGGAVELVVSFPHRAAKASEEDPDGDG